MQWEEISPVNQEDQIEAFFATKERREAVTNNPVEKQSMCMVISLTTIGGRIFSK